MMMRAHVRHILVVKGVKGMKDMRTILKRSFLASRLPGERVLRQSPNRPKHGGASSAFSWKCKSVKLFKFWGDFGLKVLLKIHIVCPLARKRLAKKYEVIVNSRIRWAYLLVVLIYLVKNRALIVELNATRFAPTHDCPQSLTQPVNKISIEEWLDMSFIR